MAFPTLVRHDQIMKVPLAKPKKAKPTDKRLSLPKVVFDTKKPEKVIATRITNTGKIVAIKIFSAIVICLLFSIAIMAAPMIASLLTSALWFIGVAANEVLLTDWFNVAFTALALFCTGATWSTLHG
jgi:hypothetical protein